MDITGSGKGPSVDLVCMETWLRGFSLTGRMLALQLCNNAFFFVKKENPLGLEERRRLFAPHLVDAFVDVLAIGCNSSALSMAALHPWYMRAFVWALHLRRNFTVTGLSRGKHPPDLRRH